MMRWSGELAEWIERRLEKVREMVADENDSESDVDEDEKSEDEAMDTQTHRRECLLTVLQLYTLIIA